MTPTVARFVKLLGIPASARPTSSFVAGAQGSVKFCYSTVSFDSDNGNDSKENETKDDNGDDYEFLREKPALHPHGVDPKRGWGFRGVHKAIICGKVGQAPVQKILRNGQTVTIFTVGTGGMYDQRIVGATALPKPVQWHRIAVHNELLGTYAVQKFVKNSSVYVEGDIETRVYNDSIDGGVKNVPEICVRRNGRIRLIKTVGSISNISIEELREGLAD
ncbi:single-stranded DNA-binding protein, mitochondrial [Diospyros lotus]|uniref:single-stranded DNA-binding protein, mitochondrial n=1 Tax=Diospyros lotus TaxID=55363 RepID=UPI002250CC05|nr:single-stranded DNA-binding protein, mitochondrial [Diospyros lotus]